MMTHMQAMNEAIALRDAEIARLLEALVPFGTSGRLPNGVDIARATYVIEHPTSFPSLAAALNSEPQTMTLKLNIESLFGYDDILKLARALRDIEADGA